MKQLLQNMRDGKTIIEEVPVPQARKGNALVRVSASLVSAGTERMLVEFAEKSLLGKARSRPDLFKQVLDKVKREGILPTLEATFNRLDQPMSLGYSTSGTITAISEGLGDFKVGDRVACAGANHAVHAEYNVIPKNLLAKIPKNVDFESAAFSTLGAIAMHGFRLAHPQLGDSICVLGLGLLGQLTVKIALAAGCRVFGIDLNPTRVERAQRNGATAVINRDAIAAGNQFTTNRGFDSVLICADSHSDEPVNLAAALVRDRGSGRRGWDGFATETVFRQGNILPGLAFLWTRQI
jgi:threonine dehydrogenase-like Zn-dependent dehydrogenase